MTDVAPYGAWASAVTAADVASEDGRPGWPGWVSGDLWWTEPRPNEGGRVTLMRRRSSPAAALAGSGAAAGAPETAAGAAAAGGEAAAEEMLAPPWYVRSRVIEYGGHPILDLAGWRNGETHDFESQYLESIVGPWPEARAVYHDRSPVNHADKLTAPFLLLQGLEDVICPPLQSERFLDRVAGRGIAHAYLAFEGEQHGFRQAGTIIAALEAELSFLGQVLGFEPRDVPHLPLVT